jgi:predicted membrane channel-forming protein YqfA (hemolysin III family)
LLWFESGFALVRPLLSGGIFYSAGAVTEFMQAPVLINGVIGPHELFHLAVLIGITYHWKLVRQITKNGSETRNSPCLSSGSNKP